MAEAWSLSEAGCERRFTCDTSLDTEKSYRSATSDGDRDSAGRCDTVTTAQADTRFKAVLP